MKHLRTILIAIMWLTLVGFIALTYLFAATPATRAEFVEHCVEHGGNKADCKAQWDEAYPGAQP